VWLVVAAGLLPGCHSPHSIVRDAPWREDASVLHDTARDAQPRAQVFICYDPVMSSHVALRLTGPMDGGRTTLLWDPAGFYGSDDPAVERRSDVLVAGVPTLAQWMDYRIAGCGENAVLMFEYDLTPGQLQRLIGPLIDGAMARGAFNPSTSGGFCCTALSGYLLERGETAWGVTGRHLMPHDFGRRLWRGGYSRAVWFAPGRLPRVYERQEVASPPRSGQGSVAGAGVDVAVNGEAGASP